MTSRHEMHVYAQQGDADDDGPFGDNPQPCEGMGREELQRQYELRCNELIQLTSDNNLLLATLVKYGQHTGSCAAFPATSPAQIIVDCNCGLMRVLAQFRKSERH